MIRSLTSFTVWSVIRPILMTETESPAKIEFEVVPRDKVYQVVAKQLAQRITEQMKPGDLLPPERELVKMLGVSRSSVRDAIRSLEQMGLLEPRQGIGTVVCGTGATHANSLADALGKKRKMIEELLEMREMIEPGLARRAALNAAPDEIAEMEGILDRQAVKMRAGEPGVEEDTEFHYGIAVASHNSVILKVVDVLMGSLRDTRERSLQVEGRQEKSLAGHRQILAALKRGDAEGAEAAMHQHLHEVETIVLENL